jgi:hypothetical protein
MKNEIDFSKYPVTSTLHFKNEEERDEFMGQLSDGWGENLVYLDWNWHSGATENDPCIYDEPLWHYLVKMIEDDE